MIPLEADECMDTSLKPVRIKGMGRVSAWRHPNPTASQVSGKDPEFVRSSPPQLIKESLGGK